MGVQFDAGAAASQTLDTVAGQFYSLNFFFAGAAPVVMVDGVVLPTVFTAPFPNVPLGFYAAQFEGTGAPVDLTFSGAGFLDDVIVISGRLRSRPTAASSCSPTPTPATRTTANFVAQGGGAGYIGTFSLDAVDQTATASAGISLPTIPPCNSGRGETRHADLCRHRQRQLRRHRPPQNVTVLLHGANDAVVNHHQ